MKSITFIVVFVWAAFTCLAQKKTSATTAVVISAATVERVEKTLAADAMQGRAGQVGGLLAAKFLAAEFNRIGLQKFPGLTSYEQIFTAYETRTTALYVMLNNVPIAKEKTLLVSGQPHLNWAEDDDPAARVIVLGAEANFSKVIRPLLEPSENIVVFVDPAHEEAFKKLSRRLQSGQLRPEKPGPFSTVLALVAVNNNPIHYRVAANTTVHAVEMRNVVGVLPGQDQNRANEQVVFSAHYDHLGILPAVAGDSIANGADDDASGTSAVVALAEYFKKQKNNARTLVFVAFAAEEIGGFGSQYFSRQISAQQVVAMFNIEMIGKPAKFGPNTAFITGYDKSDFGKILQRNLAGSAFRFEPDPYPEQQLFYRSDNATLARLGVPAHTISTDQIPTDNLYHSVDDEVESLNLKNMTAVITAIAQSAASIISGKDTPTRIVNAGTDAR
ncbi:M20/M25/M40 family metallo-hydrolase [Hymenobacter sp. BT730]|uniref:M20/M25/M40 family metallo-hydrolase n=1 Tax=Hymenobacter sp. BT730 TaxID=3063332 RepID=UPI0026E0A1B9|nr:M20/M25/M40 family metallo-hydrolase [Hymenobacter sp. BT730]